MKLRVLYIIKKLLLTIINFIEMKFQNQISF